MNSLARHLLLIGSGLWPLVAMAGEVARPRIDTHSGLQGAGVFSGSVGLGASAYAASAAAWRLWQPQQIVSSGCSGGSIAGRSRLNFGVGIRLTQVGHGAATDYAGRGDAAGRTLQLENPAVTALNLAVQARVRLFNVRTRRAPVWLGFTIDLAGGSVGPARRITGDAPTPVSAVPAPLNLLLVNQNDRGTLNSEFYVAYTIPRSVTVSAGLAHVATGYVLDNFRFQRFTNLAFVGVSYSPSRKWRSF